MRCAGWLRLTWVRCLLAAASVGAASGGCHRVSKYPGEYEFYPVAQPQNENPSLGGVQPVPASNPYAHLETYPLRVDDLIQFTLSVVPQPKTGSYRLNVHDQLAVEYLHESAPENRSQAMRVLPNGSIDLRLIGSITAVGKTVEELTREVNERAAKYYNYPQITITVTETSSRAEELRRTFTSGFTNQSLSLRVGPDGTINLPEIGTVFVFGKTVPLLRDEVNDAYAKVVPGVHVWPALERRAPDQIYVLGEVRNPNRYLVDRPTHISHAIALAGGWNLAAELHEVVLIRYAEGWQRATILNLHCAIRHDHGPRCVDLTDDMELHDGDIVIVPKDHLQNTNDYIRRVFVDGIYGIIPIPRLRSN